MTFSTVCRCLLMRLLKKGQNFIKRQDLIESYQSGFF